MSMSRFRQPAVSDEFPEDEYEPRVEDDFWQGAPPYSDEASPDQDARREQLENLPQEAERAEPDAEPLEGTTRHPGPIPYVNEGHPPPAPRDPASSLPDDGQAATHSIDTAQTVLSADPQRRAWTVYVPGSSAAGVRLAIGRRAREDIESDVTTILLPAGASLDGETTAPVAVKSATAGTAATVCVITERNAR